MQRRSHALHDPETLLSSPGPCFFNGLRQSGKVFFFLKSQMLCPLNKEERDHLACYLTVWGTLAPTDFINLRLSLFQGKMCMSPQNMLNHILHLFQQHDFKVEESRCWTDLPAVQTFHQLKTFAAL